MADNLDKNTRYGTMATDEIGGVQYPRMKMTAGPDGTAMDIVANGEGILQTGNVRNCFVDDFGGTALDATKWDVVHTVAGATVSVTAGDLRIVMPATNGVDVSLLSKDVFRLPVDMSFVAGILAASSANTEFTVELVEVDANGAVVPHAVTAGEANNRAGLMFTGGTTTAPSLRSMSQSSTTALVTAASGFPTVVNTGAEFLLEYRPEDTMLTATTKDATATKVAGGVRHSSQSIDPEKLYKVRIRVRNTAAATAVTFFMSRILVADVQEMRVEVVSGRGDQVANKALPVQVISGVSLNSAVNATIGQVVPTISPTVSQATADLKHRRLSTADTNLVNVKASVSRLFGGIVTNLLAAGGATRYLKLYNKATAPVLATDIPVLTIPIRANTELYVGELIGPFAASFSTGLSYAITGAYADTDATAIGAGDVVINLLYV